MSSEWTINRSEERSENKNEKKMPNIEETACDISPICFLYQALGKYSYGPKI